MTQVEIGLSAVVSDKDFAVLKRRHGARIDVQIRVELHDRDPHSTLDQKSSKRCGCNSLPERRDHAARDEDVARLLAGTTLHCSLLLP